MSFYVCWNHKARGGIREWVQVREKEDKEGERETGVGEREEGTRARNRECPKGWTTFMN